jgi:nucleoid-associated protein YgaU
MGCVQQAVLEFDEEVRAPWRPRLVSDAGAGSETVRHPSRHAPSRVGACVPTGGPAVAVRGGGGAATRRVAVRSAAIPVATASPAPVRSGSAARARGARSVRGPRGVPARTGRAQLRLTRRARRLAFVLALASGVALGSWLGPLLGGHGDLRLAGESSVVVQSGDTLWSIARSVAGPGDDVRAVVDGIQRSNGLRTADVVPGQVLQLP